MSYCLNPNCSKPHNPDAAKICRNCRSKLLLRDRYRAIKAIGQGGFGRTFLAVDEDKPSKPRCVIKQFLPDSQLIPSGVDRNSKKAAQLFEQEAMRLDELGKHPQIPELLAYSTQDNRQYVVQEFIDGQNLAQIVEQEGTFTETQIKDLLNSLLPVIHFIHSHNVIHRDIKPGNIIRRADKQLVLVDFGAAKIATGTALLKTGTSIGSPEYIAPEQARGKAFFTSDLYSLGVTCLYLLTQVSPFDLFDPGEDAWIWRQYLTNNPVSEELGKILDKMIDNATNRRYQTAVEVLKEINPQSAIDLAIPEKQSNKLIKPEKTTAQPQQPTYNWQCIHTLTGHKNLIYSVAFSPNGEVIASASDDKTIKLWRVEDGQEIVTLAGHTNSVYTVAFSPDGLMLASSSHDKTIKLWRMKDGQEMRSLVGHSNSVYGAAFSPDGTLIASSSWDRTIKIWRIKDGQEICTLAGHINLVYCVAFSPDGETLASSSWDRTIKIWRVKDGKLIRTLTGHTDSVRCIAFSPNGEFLASGSHDNTIKIWWVKDWQEVLTIRGHSWYVDSIAFSPDSEILASSSNQTIKIWRVKDGEEICNIAGHTNSVYSVNFSPEGEFLASGSSDKTIKIWQNTMFV
ncbi:MULTISPECIES: serine/threonine-protein kinase [unclassified Microcoleus]|uniref:serine/threonine-protein kinase n=1 Tax=unclassified Microcoleus TaxID=2642155 RepID=UPI0025FCF2A4|nr:MULTISPECIES: serine/threonine-protein kinase [unclassified Microcoleus]